MKHQQKRHCFVCRTKVLYADLLIEKGFHEDCPKLKSSMVPFGVDNHCESPIKREVPKKHLWDFCDLIGIWTYDRCIKHRTHHTQPGYKFYYFTAFLKVTVSKGIWSLIRTFQGFQNYKLFQYTCVFCWFFLMNTAKAKVTNKAT